MLQALSTTTRKHRRLTLLPWKLTETAKEDTAHPLGWAVEHRDDAQQIHQVVVGWGDVGWGDRNSDLFPTEEEERSTSVRVASAVTISLPYISDANADTLASSLWPASIVGAIIAQSPTLRGIFSPKHDIDEEDNDADGRNGNTPVNILELGAGLGLLGLAVAQGSTTCSVMLTDNDNVVVGKLQDKLEDNGRVNAEYLDWRDEDSAKAQRMMSLWGLP